MVASGHGCRVLVVDDHPVLRRGLLALLATEPWVEATFEAGTEAEAVAQAVTHRVDLVAMDVALREGGDGVEATRRIVRARPEALVLIVTMSDDEAVVGRALRAGARGYVLKDSDPQTLVEALHTVASGGFVLGPGVGPSLVQVGEDRRRPDDGPLARLTPRERELLAGLAAGDSNARIARHLGISEKTVRNSMSSVFAKLGVGDRVQAALLAREVGLPGQRR
jgi:DNA-binding NarL/FixJ family response regulator